MNRLLWSCTASLLLVAACSGGGDGGNGGPSAPLPPAPVASVAVTLGASTVAAGGSTSASAALSDAAGRALSGRSVSWTTSTPAVATVDGGGVVTAIGAGSATITATSEGITGSAVVTVTPPPVATVLVSLSASSITAGSSALATAALHAANGSTLTGRTVTWSSSAPGVAIVDPQGTIVAVAPGTATIFASSEGRTGTATLVVTAPPIASVVLNGSLRVKVGDPYTYSVIARLADGTVVVRPVSWSVRETGQATMSASGVLTPVGAGAITIVATIDGRQWEGFTTAYDWDGFSSGGSDFTFLEADNQITNKFGRSEYARLVFVCSGLGNFFGWVSTTNFVTASGLVAYSFDGGPITSAMWEESDDFSALFKPGNNLVVKTFAQQVAGSRTFGFAFTEFNASAKAMTFRVTGFGARLAPLMAKCPSNARVTGEPGAGVAGMLGARTGARVTVDKVLAAERQLRAARGPVPATTPSLDIDSRSGQSQLAQPRR